MSWSTKNIPDLHGKVAVVTGANGGLGLASAKALAGSGAHIVMAVRNQAKAADAHAEILAAHPTASLEIVELDLGSLASVKTAAGQIAAKHAHIDILMCNAGVMAMPEGTTEDGFVIAEEDFRLRGGGDPLAEPDSDLTKALLGS